MKSKLVHIWNVGCCLACLLFLVPPSMHAKGWQRQCYNLDLDWNLWIGDMPAEAFFKALDANQLEGVRDISLPRAFNGEEAYEKAIAQLTDTVVWYTKTFKLPKSFDGGKVFVEFEGVRHGADVYLNGKHIGFHENGVMAFGMDLTPYIKKKGENRLSLRIDNSWTYRDREENSRFQWNDRNFNANYGGIPKHVYLHLTGPVYQTLPLYSNLGTTGVYVYASDFDIEGHAATIHVEAEVKNESPEPKQVRVDAMLSETDGMVLAHEGRFQSQPVVLAPGEVRVLKMQARFDGLHFWSWGYGYLYDVTTSVVEEGKVVDEVKTRTGFRQTAYKNGMVTLNGRVLQMKGFAQRTSNEWPGTGMSVPAWLSDYSNGMMVEGNANLVRWMHVTPWKQDVESCDRVGLIQAMPAGDSERDVTGRRWEHRTMLMRDAIIYNRNNPSILFYECGNESISDEHMKEMKAIRDLYDPHGGRAIGSREMLDIESAEYGGEMLYINKSGDQPFWAMEYCRDEGLRAYWDNWSYPFHRSGDGPLYKNADASAYNHNQDRFAIEHIVRWYDYWRERPGTGKRVSSGGVKIIFSDTNTHCRGESNYRTSGVTDAVRIPKDTYFVHQLMWNGWVDNEEEATYIIGHWNYPENTKKPVYVASTAPQVELLLNGKSLGMGERTYVYLHTFNDVVFEEGQLVAVGRDEQGRQLSADTLQTAGAPVALRMTCRTAPNGFHADGADMALVEIEVVDAEGRRCPTDHTMIQFQLEGEAEWIGGIARDDKSVPRRYPTNFVGAKELPVECGVNRVLVRSTRKAGEVTLTAAAEGFAPVSVQWESEKVASRDGLTTYMQKNYLESNLSKGETPATSSYRDVKQTVEVASVKAGSNQERATYSCDDNELSEWSNDGRLSTAWISFELKERAAIDEVCLKLTGWRMRSYPIEIYADTTLVWAGSTPKSLGYVHLPVKPVEASRIMIQLKGSVSEQEAFGQIQELVAPVAGELDLFKAEGSSEVRSELRIVEVDFLKHLAEFDADERPHGKYVLTKEKE